MSDNEDINSVTSDEFDDATSVDDIEDIDNVSNEEENDGDEDADDEPEEDEDEDEDEEEEDDEEDDDKQMTKPKIKIGDTILNIGAVNGDGNVDVDDVDESDDEDDTDDEDDDYLQKLDEETNKNFIVSEHPESIPHNYDEIRGLSKITRNKKGVIIDKLHRTIPILTKFEKTRVLGVRSKQINDGAKPFVKVPSDIIDGYTIAQIELKQKKIPFIIKRPLPNGGCEYWNIKDLEIIN